MAPRPLVICGPSGVGKGTLLKKLLEDHMNAFGFSVSHTTRQPRPGEEHGKDYFFVNREEMDEAIENGEFIEHAVYSGNCYGTSKEAVEAVLESGRICILDIDTQGVKQVKNTDLNPFYVFIKPPTIEDLEKRLQGRGTETEESMARRLKAAQEEIEYGETPDNFCIVIVNDEVDRAYEELKQFILPEIKKIEDCESD
ncbi:guanylate kinase-like isoform X2 [Oratosquilla oratoria]